MCNTAFSKVREKGICSNEEESMERVLGLWMDSTD